MWTSSPFHDYWTFLFINILGIWTIIFFCRFTVSFSFNVFLSFLFFFSPGESIPIRLFLSPYELTPTYRNINNKFSVKYFLNLVLVDEEDRRYFKQQEITIYRLQETSWGLWSREASEFVKETTNGSDLTSASTFLEDSELDCLCSCFANQLVWHSSFLVTPTADTCIMTICKAASQNAYDLWMLRFSSHYHHIFPLWIKHSTIVW